VRIIWSEIAQATFVRFMADQAGMMAVNRAVEALADDPAPPGAFVRGAYRRLRVGPYRVLYEVEGNLITIRSSRGNRCRLAPSSRTRSPLNHTCRTP
jgi:hypothetical protein